MCTKILFGTHDILPYTRYIVIMLSSSNYYYYVTPKKVIMRNSHKTDYFALE